MEQIELEFDEPLAFEWDKGNIDKNRKHRVENKECEEVFADKNKKIFEDKKHSGKETRFILLGKTHKNKLLFLVFTVREEKVRVISARPINKKEVLNYEETA